MIGHGMRRMMRDGQVKLVAAVAGGLKTARHPRLLPVWLLSALVLGAILPLVFFNVIPRDHQAEARLRLEGARLEAVQAALLSLRAPARLDRLARSFELDHKPEFAVNRPSAVALIADIVSGRQTSVAEAEKAVRTRLSAAIAHDYDALKGELSIRVALRDPALAVAMADRLARDFADEFGFPTAIATDPRLESSRAAMEKAQAALSGFTDGADQARLAEWRAHLRDENGRAGEIAAAEAEHAALRGKLANISGLTVDNVLSSALPDSIDYTGLEYHRRNYVSAKLAVDQLAADLGPRHPRLIGARQALEESRQAIRAAIVQLSASLRQQEKQAGDRLAALKAQAARTAGSETAISARKLAALETEAAQARDAYASALAQDNAGFGRLAAETGGKAQIIRPASAAGSKALGPGRAELAATGAATAGGLALLAALLLYMRRRPETVEAAEALAAPALQPMQPQPMMRAPALSEQDADLSSDHDLETALIDPFSHELPEQHEGDDGDPYPQPANDGSLADLIREILMENRRPQQAGTLPPHIEAILRGEVVAGDGVVEQAPPAAWDDDTRLDELLELRDHLTRLRDRVDIVRRAG